MSEDDPFENLDPPEDREGDPFERLGDPEDDDTDGADDIFQDEDTTDDAAVDEEPIDDAAVDESDWTDSVEETGADDGPTFEEEFIDDGETMSAGPTPSTGEDDPFSAMDGRDGDPFGEGESAFEAVDVESLDHDEVWESLDADESTPSPGQSRYTDVSKHRFCEQCEHFSSPPAAHCTHEEAEIIEYLDMETVRLLNCPVVAEQRELEDEG